MVLSVPHVLSHYSTPHGNVLLRIAAPSQQLTGHVSTFTREKMRGWLFQPDDGAESVLIVPAKTKPAKIPATYNYVLAGSVNEAGRDHTDLSGSKWIRHPHHLVPIGHSAALDSWRGAFSYVEEDRDNGVVGLRPPQIGALHAIHAHWSVTNDTATIVLPTGTGKTETMLSVLVSARCSRVLVIVPTDALRSQISDKFATLGVLKTPGASILRADVLHPAVLVLKRVPKTAEIVRDLAAEAHVIVTTSSVIAQSAPDVQGALAETCSHLFIDEAHHAEAPTWRAFKNRFPGRILQFTATPFREDGQPLDGKLIYVYPLRKAQEEGYFKPIHFVNVVEFDPLQADRAIAAAALEQLRIDYDRGHILMARVATVTRANEVFKIYEAYPELCPVLIHSQLGVQAREEARRKILSKEARIIVCVDMLGEGFDLPELKIAAFHDIRKTLAVTLQLAGRFTRSRPDLGNATFIANTADVDVRDELRKLYAREPDWNVLLPELAETVIGGQRSLQEFLEGFTEFADDIPLNAVRPALSTVVYRTRGEWVPENVRDGIPNLAGCEQVHVATNERQNTVVVVTARRTKLAWADIDSLYDWDWDLFVIFWWRERGLLFINGSSNAGDFKSLARAMAGDDAQLVKGDTVFRSFAGVSRLQLNNVGLSEQLGRNVSFTGRMGADVAPALTEAQRRRARKSVLAGSGYEGGAHVSVGASIKGRIWSHRRDRLDELVTWCKELGRKLLDETIDPEAVLRGTLIATVVEARPDAMPIGVDWPTEIYEGNEKPWAMSIGDITKHLSEVELEVTSATLAGPLRFAIVADDVRAEFELEFFRTGEVVDYRFVLLDHRRVTLHRAETDFDAAAFFTRSPPRIWFHNGASLDGDEYTPLRHELPPYDADRIETWDWTDTNIRKESRGDTHDPESIQAGVITQLLDFDYDIIFDDDDAGESADVVTIRLLGGMSAPSAIEIEFYHLKFSSADSPGARIGDLYVVCGQAQTSVRWMASPEKRTDLFTHLLRREAKRRQDGRPSRFVRGDVDTLHAIREISRSAPVSLKIAVVQPGVSKAGISNTQLELLAVTDNYLTETYQLPFRVITSA